MKRPYPMNYKNQNYKKRKQDENNVMTSYPNDNMPMIKPSQKKYILKSINPNPPELKCVDTPLADDVVINNPTFLQNNFLCLNLVQQGAAYYNRIGTKINLKSLKLRLRFTVNTNLSNANTTFRILVVYDKNNNGYPPVVQDILQSIYQDGTSVLNVYSSVNINYRDRFEILLDEFITLPPVSSPTPGQFVIVGGLAVPYTYEKYLKLKDRPQMYRGTASPITIGSVVSGAIYLLPISDLPQASLLNPYDMGGEARVRFTD